MATVDELIRKLEEGSSMQRQHAAKELGELGDPKAIEPLVKRMLHDGDKTVQCSAAVALGKIGKPEAIPGLAEAVRTGGYSELRSLAAVSLGLIRHPDAIPALIEASYSPDLHVRSQAVWSLAQFRDSKVIAALIDRLGVDYDDIENVAWDAIRKHMLIHPDAILKLPIEKQNRLGRQLQEQYREELQDELCE
jgi:HEAT repeat protein